MNQGSIHVVDQLDKLQGNFMTSNKTQELKANDVIFDDIDKNFSNILHVTKNDQSGKLFSSMIVSTLPNITDEDYQKSIAITDTVKNSKNQESANLAKESIENLRNIHKKFPKAAIYTTLLLESAIAETMARD